MSYLLGIDIGTSAIKASLLDPSTGLAAADSPVPDAEIPRYAPAPGWCEQAPEDWWEATRQAVLALPQQMRAQVAGIGIAYQMHGLVLLNETGRPVRPSIIWSDARATACGDRLYSEIGEASFAALLNRPGNFTASKLRWVKENEPENLSRVWKVMLPGDYVAYRLTGSATTTSTGLSEMIAWDFSRETIYEPIWAAAGASPDALPTLVPIFGRQCEVSASIAADLGIPAGTPVCYRAGDQPNNALSLNVLEPGEMAATAGTSGVLYGVASQVRHDPRERVNTFLHVNHRPEAPRLGTLLCVNGAGGFYSWVRKTYQVASFQALNELAEASAIGARGLVALPYGNGGERSLGNRAPGASLYGIDVNRHGLNDVSRAAQEGVLFALRYGADALAELGATTNLIRAGCSNMFKSELFCQSFATVMNADLELLETDGALGAARGAGIGAGLFGSFPEAFAGLRRLITYHPRVEDQAAYAEAYDAWKAKLAAL
jgi:xylulokinase